MLRLPLYTAAAKATTASMCKFGERRQRPVSLCLGLAGSSRHLAPHHVLASSHSSRRCAVTDNVSNSAHIDLPIPLPAATMPPRLQVLSRASIAASKPSYQPLAPFLYPTSSLRQTRRPASILSQLSDNKSAYNKKIRVGRGPSSGYGKTSGRGHKGQKQHGKVPVGFNGGQTPDWVVSGKRGEKNRQDLIPV